MNELNGPKTFTESFIGELGTFARWMREPDSDEEIEDDSMYMGSDSDFSDRALGIDY